MSKEVRPRILVYQSIGFLAIIALSWLDECLDLSTLILGEHPYLPTFRVFTLEMLLILAVWFLVSRATARFIERMRQLERYMKLCAWCHRVEYKGDWIRLEEFLEKGFDTPTSHGICGICLHREKAIAERVKQSMGGSRSETPPLAADGLGA
jgi:hypothetical protein